MPKITELPSGSALAGTEPAPVVQAGATVQVPVSYYKTYALGDFSADGLSLGAAADYAAMRGLLDLEPGTDFNPYSPNLAALSAMATTGVLARTGAGTYSARTLTAGTGISITDGDGVGGNPTITCTVMAGTGTVTHTAGALTLNQLVFGNGTDDIKVGNLTGDVTTSGGTATTIAAGAVTLSKIANASANSKLLGSGAAGSGSSYAELTLGTGLSFSGTTLNVSGFATTGAITGSGLTMATARLLGRTTASTGAVEEITVSTGLTFSATTLAVDTGTSGAKVPLLNGANTWSAAQTDSALATFSAGADMTPASAPSTTAVGYLGAPVLTSLDSGNVAPALADCGKTFYHTDANARNFTIPANGSVAFPVGTILLIEQGPSAAAVSVIITTDTLQWGSSTGTRSLAANGACTIQKLSSTVWRIRGEGIT